VTGSYRPFGTVDAAEVSRHLQAARDLASDVRHDLHLLRDQVAWLEGNALVELDLRRAMTALGAAVLALDRGLRNVELLG
jgi:hypothetical protein